MSFTTGLDSGILSSCSVALLISRAGSAQPDWGSPALNAGLQPEEQLPGQDTAPSLLPPCVRGRRADASTLRGEAGLVQGEGSHHPHPPGSQCDCAVSPPVRTDLGTFTHGGVLIRLVAPVSVGSYLRWYVLMSSRLLFPNSSCTATPAHTHLCHRRCPTSGLERPGAHSQADHGEQFPVRHHCQRGKRQSYILLYKSHFFFKCMYASNSFLLPMSRKQGCSHAGSTCYVST